MLLSSCHIHRPIQLLWRKKPGTSESAAAKLGACKQSSHRGENGSQSLCSGVMPSTNKARRREKTVADRKSVITSNVIIPCTYCRTHCMQRINYMHSHKVLKGVDPGRKKLLSENFEHLEHWNCTCTTARKASGSFKMATAKALSFSSVNTYSWSFVGNMWNRLVIPQKHTIWWAGDVRSWEMPKQ